MLVLADRFLLIVLAASLTAALFVRIASAASYSEVRATEAGFAALRAGPSERAKLLERMKPDDEILIGQGKSGEWIEVTYWRGGRFDSGKNPQGDPPTAIGWMHSRMVVEDSCS